jgi:hypothetical protein
MNSTFQYIRFRLELFTWARLLPILAYRRDLKSLMAKADPSARRRYVGMSSADVIKRVRRAVRRPWFMRNRQCLREGVLAYRFLTLAGFDPEIHFGVDRTSIAKERLSAHCWIALNDNIILNPPTPSMIEVLVLRTNDTHSL